MLAKVNKSYLPDFMNDFFKNDYISGLSDEEECGLVPAVNIFEDENGYEIEVAAPGLNKKDFKIGLENDMLTISSEKKSNHKERKGRFMRREFNYSSFRRSFYLPDSVDMDKINATHEDGILRINIPMKEEALKKGPKSIEIA